MSLPRWSGSLRFGAPFPWSLFSLSRILGKGISMGSSSRFAALSGLVLLVSFQASAIPTVVVGVDTAHCDVLSVPAVVEELGTGGLFPAGEQIVSGLLSPSGAIAGVGPAGVNCTTGTIDSPFIANHGVTITNTTGFNFLEVWYVANAQTNLSNLDGSVNGFGAFRIDQVGVNKPLISESVLTDGVFQAGETWAFMIQDYANNAGMLANAFAAPGVPSLGIGDGSSGSIIGVLAPEPGTGGLLIMGLLALARYGRRSN